MILEESFGILLIILCLAVAISFLCCILKFYSFCASGYSTAKPSVDVERQRVENVTPFDEYPQSFPYSAGQAMPVIWTSSGHYHQHPHPHPHAQPYHNGLHRTRINQNHTLVRENGPPHHRGPAQRASRHIFGTHTLRRARSEHGTVGHPDVRSLETDFEQVPPPSYEEVMRKSGQYPMGRSVSEAALYQSTIVVD